MGPTDGILETGLSKGGRQSSERGFTMVSRFGSKKNGIEYLVELPRGQRTRCGVAMK